MKERDSFGQALLTPEQTKVSGQTSRRERKLPFSVFRLSSLRLQLDMGFHADLFSDHHGLINLISRGHPMEMISVIYPTPLGRAREYKLALLRMKLDTT